MVVRILYRVLFFFFRRPLCLSGASCESLLQSLLLQDPIVLEIEVKVLSHEKLPEHLDTILVVWFLIEFQLPAVVKELAELFGVARGQVLDARNGLLNLNLLILFFLGLSWQSLPWEAPADKVH